MAPKYNDVILDIKGQIGIIRVRILISFGILSAMLILVLAIDE